MYDPELERIRRQRMLELQRRLAAEQEAQRQQMIAQMQIKAALKAILTKEAYERLGRVKMANPDLYARAVQTLLYLYQAGRISGKLTDAQLKSLLERLRGKKRETRIRILEK